MSSFTCLRKSRAARAGLELHEPGARAPAESLAASATADRAAAEAVKK
jgi:hypothetical protein